MTVEQFMKFWKAITLTLAEAILFSSWKTGTVYLIFFGIVSLLAILIIPYVDHNINSKLKLKFSKFFPFTISLFSVLLILKVSNFSIQTKYTNKNLAIF